MNTPTSLNGHCRALAHALCDAGISSIAVYADGSKSPSGKWKVYQIRLATHAEIDGLYALGRRGIGVVAGEVSGGLEIIDFDEPTLIDPWIALVEHAAPGLVDRLPRGETPSGGAHFYYRHAATQEGSQKLAQELRPNADGNLTPYTLIETRGQGGYAIVAPSPAVCHPDRARPYVQRSGALTATPLLTEAERTLLLDTARQLGRYEPAPPPTRTPPRRRSGDEGARPGDEYAMHATWDEILEPAGWRRCGGPSGGESATWRRPGKHEGVSATTDYAGSGLLYVFSSNAAPFEPDRSYSKFGAYALLNHGGDFEAAARYLRKAGYGQHRPAPRPGTPVRPSTPTRPTGVQLPAFTRPTGVRLPMPTRPRGLRLPEVQR